jgi:hypothetical protein
MDSDNQQQDPLQRIAQSLENLERLYAEPAALPKWFWFVLAGGIAGVAAIVGIVIALGH